MAFKLHKRAISYLSLVLALGILTPSVVKLAHAIYGHSQEQKCLAQGTNHIHSANFHCDFHDFTLASKVFFNSSFTYLPVEVPEIVHNETAYHFVFKPFKAQYHALRGPPRVVTSTAV
ncbi:hypothetical protein [Flagellimonas pelagia]|uniref:DUF2607 family protein n=1 Tax=Flagellimonas pelagia TaxID=2306998 RepID=A0A3A1NKM3_9FLAO|nr:hypothetical protein [Allomuricauda maritima]RIV45889.1 hypothetical protein D2V05_04735 [Allomuricauda maritima]TXJ98650.1 hypothetical protein FQ017_04700 [Allomuricauda maritima]